MKANVASIFKNGQKDNLGNYRLVSLTSVPEKIMEQVLLENSSGHMKEKATGNSHHGFTKDKS